MKQQKPWEHISLIVYDFDGVMTDNRVMVDQHGVESVMVNRGDGYGIAQIKKMGILQVIISTETNEVVKRRAEKLQIDIIHGVEDKRSILQNYCIEQKIALENVLFLGNDLNDYDAMMITGFRGAPADAEEEILAIADWISKSNGGYGVIRELYRKLSSISQIARR
ncbi:MAG TPA: HAD hydrolase family protein [Lachnospiraceae bacterium]|nr:HAD hydrolase family protein [Lachnospiraceae bacterium]HPF28514.1 HAD hydrolase family protein [Lachnospiraceae bacterium]